MRRSALTLTVAATVALGGPAVAYAVLADVGTAGGDVPPACPGKPCLAVSRTTGYQAKVGDTRPIDVVQADGRIVAWTISLGNPGTKQTKFFNTNLGGESVAQLTVLRPGHKLYARVIAQGNPVKLQRYFGSKVQFALDRSIPVKKGYIIALTVPTWAPALGVNQPGTTSWRATRGKGKCNDFDTQTAQTGANTITRAYCLYRTARLTYSATVVTDPEPSAGAPTTTTTTPTTTATTTTPTATTTTPAG